MPEWSTPLLRVLVAIPSLGNCSTRKTSCQRFETASAMAQPITPPPMIRMLAWSMNSEYRKWKKENRKIVRLEAFCSWKQNPEDLALCRILTGVGGPYTRQRTHL